MVIGTKPPTAQMVCQLVQIRLILVAYRPEFEAIPFSFNAKIHLGSLEAVERKAAYAAFRSRTVRNSIFLS